MAVIREQRQFKIGPIGIARASEGGKIVGEAISRSADQFAETFFRRAASEAEKSGTEAAMSVGDVTTIDPKTGQPVAYDVPQGFGSIGADAYQRVVLRRFQQSIDDEIKLKAQELAVRFEGNPNSVALYTTAMSDYLASMTNVAQGQFKGYIQDVGTSYLNSTRTALTIDKIRSERAAAKKSQNLAVENGLNNIEYNVATLGPAALNGPTQTEGLIESVNVTINDGQQSGLFTPSETSGYSAKQRLAVTKGLVRYAAKQTNDPETLQLLQAAVGTQNPNLVPKGFEYVADAIRGMGNDYGSLADLEKFSDGLLGDAVSYANVLQEQEVRRQEADAAINIFNLEQNAPAIAAAETNIAIREETDPLAFAFRSASGFNQLTAEARSLLASGREKESEAAIKQRDIRLKGQVEGLYLRALQGLSTEDTRELERAISDRDPSIAPVSAQPALTALIRIQNATGSNVLSDFGPHISSYRDAAGKQIDLQIKAQAASEVAKIDVAAIEYSKDPMADVKTALEALNGIQGIDDGLFKSTKENIIFTGGKSSLSQFFATSPTDAQINEAMNLLEGGAVAEGVLTEKQLKQLSYSKEAAEAAGKLSEMRTVFNRQSKSVKERRQEAEKVLQKQIDLQNIRLGQGDPTSKEQRILVEEDFQQRYSAALNGRTLSSIWSDPAALQDENLRPLFNELSSAHVMPESLQNAFISLAKGNFSGLNPQIILSHYENFKNYSYAGVTIDNGMMNALTDTDKAMLSYLSDAVKTMGTEALPEIFRTKREFQQDPLFKKRVEATLGGSLEDFVMSLDGIFSAPPSAYDSISAAALNLFAASRAEGLDAGDIKDRLERQIEHSYPSGGGIVYGPNFSDRTAYPLSKAAPRNEDLFKDYLIDVVTSRGKITGVPVLGKPSARRPMPDDAQFIYLQPLDTAPDGEIRYIVKQRGRAETGGDTVVRERITNIEDGAEYSVPLIVSNRDPEFLFQVRKRTNSEQRREIEEGKRRLQSQEDLLQQSFSEIEGYE